VTLPPVPATRPPITSAPTDPVPETASPTIPVLEPAQETTSPTAGQVQETSSPTVGEASPPTATSIIPITSSPTNVVSILNPPTAQKPTDPTLSMAFLDEYNASNPIFGKSLKSSKKGKAGKVSSKQSRPSGKSTKNSKVEGKAGKSTKGSKAYLTSLYRTEDVSSADLSFRQSMSSSLLSISVLGSAYFLFC